MRLIIAGSRKLYAPAVREWLPNLVAHMCKTMRLPEPTVILSGACPTGVDVAGEGYAEDAGLAVERFPADWKGMGKMAGPLRNHDMATRAEALLLVWTRDPLRSPGSANMLRTAIAAGLPVMECGPNPTGGDWATRPHFPPTYSRVKAEAAP